MLKLSFALMVIAPFAAVQAGCGGGSAKADGATGGDAQVDKGPSASAAIHQVTSGVFRVTRDRQ